LAKLIEIWKEAPMEGSVKFPLLVQIGKQTWQPWEILVSDWLDFFLFSPLSSESTRYNDLLLCMSDVWGFSTNLSHLVMIDN
jgi:hypothetical protein